MQQRLLKMFPPNLLKLILRRLESKGKERNVWNYISEFSVLKKLKIDIKDWLPGGWPYILKRFKGSLRKYVL